MNIQILNSVASIVYINKLLFDANWPEPLETASKVLK